jgi:hypothetical protein
MMPVVTVPSSSTALLGDLHAYPEASRRRRVIGGHDLTMPLSGAVLRSHQVLGYLVQGVREFLWACCAALCMA